MSEITPQTEDGKADGRPRKAPARKPRTAAKKAAKEYFAGSVPGSRQPIPPEFGQVCERLGAGLGLPVWLLVHNTYDREDFFAELGGPVRDAFFRARKDLAKSQRIVLVVDSPGGYARCAYEVSRLLQRHCGGFVAAVPRFAKSAGTLLVLGAEILMGADAELGPLDAQIWDSEREEESSALNEVQALERLHTQAVAEVDQMVPLLVGRTGKKIDTLMPLVLDFVAQMKRPLLEKIDTVHYTQQSRVLKEAEDYAVRLLRRSGLYEEWLRQPEDVASRLVNRFSDHGFVIDREEAQQFLRVVEPQADEIADALSDLADYLTDNSFIAIGRLDVKNSN